MSAAVPGRNQGAVAEAVAWPGAATVRCAVASRSVVDGAGLAARLSAAPAGGPGGLEDAARAAADAAERAAWGAVGNTFSGGVLDAMSVVLVDLEPAEPVAPPVPDLADFPGGDAP